MQSLSAVPGVNGPAPTSFEEFWPYYVSQHLHPLTRLMHVAGTLGGITAGAAGIVRRRRALLALAPLIGFGSAWFSHFVIEGNKPASFGNPLWSFRADFRLIRRFFSGTLDADVAQVRTALGLREDQIRIVDAPELVHAA
jgi:hypothetical protein